MGEKPRAACDVAAACFMRYARYGFSGFEDDLFALCEIIRGSTPSESEARRMLAVGDTLRILRLSGRGETAAVVRAVYFVRHGRRPRRQEISHRVRRFAAENHLDERSVYRRLADAKRLLSRLLADADARRTGEGGN